MGEPGARGWIWREAAQRVWRGGGLGGERAAVDLVRGSRRVWRVAHFKKQDPGSFGSEVLCPAGDRSASMVGSNGLEPSTPCMSSKYSNQLS